MSFRLRLLIAAQRLFLKPAIARSREPEKLRRLFERGARQWLRPPPETLILPMSLGAFTALRIANRPASHPPRRKKVILFFHGGGFIAGSPETHAPLAARLARMTRCEVILPRWPLAPEAPFPAGPEAAHAAFGALVARGYAPGDILLAGDSAGGNIALGLLARLLAQGLRPAGVVAFSPVTDLTFSGASVRENRDRDSMLPAAQRDQVEAFYLAGADPADPRASPLFASYPKPPPVFLQVSDSEILRDDSLRLATRLRAAGGRVTLDRWADAPHAFVLYEGLVPEAREAARRAAAFVNDLFATQASARDEASR